MVKPLSIDDGFDVELGAGMSWCSSQAEVQPLCLARSLGTYDLAQLRSLSKLASAVFLVRGPPRGWSCLLQDCSCVSECCAACHKLLPVGVTVDAIQAIRDLYTDATTRVKLSYDETDAINIDRGSIQGYTLSPFLYLVFIEPLLRWLHSGGRGYKYGCLKGSRHADYTTSALAYADDLAATTLRLEDLKLQARKIEAFTAWSGMKVNCAKCAVTGIPYAEAKKRGTDAVLSSKNIAMLKRRCAEVKIQGTSIPFHHPDTEPYKYLGVWITPTMNWSHNLVSILEEFRDRASKLSVSMLSSRQKMRAQASKIKACVTYSFPLGTLTEADLAKLDGMNARLCKKINGLSNSAPTAIILEDRDKAGVGLTSLSVDYVQLIARKLTLALNDKGALGFINGSLMRLQDSIIGLALEHTKKKSLIKGTAHYHLARQLSIIKQAGIHAKAPTGEEGLRGNALADIIAKLKYDPSDFGMSCRIPPNVSHVCLSYSTSTSRHD